MDVPGAAVVDVGGLPVEVVGEVVPVVGEPVAPGGVVVVDEVTEGEDVGAV